MVQVSSKSSEFGATGLLQVAEGKDLLPFGPAVLSQFVIAQLIFLTWRGWTLSPVCRYRATMWATDSLWAPKPGGWGQVLEVVEQGSQHHQLVLRNTHTWLSVPPSRKELMFRPPQKGDPGAELKRGPWSEHQSPDSPVSHICWRCWWLGKPSPGSWSWLFQKSWSLKWLEHVNWNSKGKDTNIKKRCCTKIISDNFNLSKCCPVTLQESENKVLLCKVIDNGDYTCSCLKYRYTYKWKNKIRCTYKQNIESHNN